MAQGVALFIDVLVHRNEPLRRVAEDDRLFRAPRMRILMLKAAARDDVAGFRQSRDDGVIGVALLALVVDDALALEAGRGCGQRAVLIDGVGNDRADAARFQCGAAGGPDLEVLAAMPRRGVDEAGAGVVGDVIAGKQRHLEVVAFAVQGMFTDHAGKHLGGNVGDLVVSSDLGLLEHFASEILRQDVEIAELRPIVLRRVGDLVEAVADLRRKRDRAIARQCPWRRGPDDDVERFVRRQA